MSNYKETIQSIIENLEQIKTSVQELSDNVDFENERHNKLLPRAIKFLNYTIASLAPVVSNDDS